jgi:nicotinamidase-related amidase
MAADGKSAGMAMLIIDPQVDFHEGGNLAVAGATADSEKISAFITKNTEKIDHIFVSLDTHHRMHIAHGAFWKNDKGESPAPFTPITNADVLAGKWVARDPAMQEWALTYTKSLDDGGRFTHLIWPYHCVLGSPGHAVSPALMPALDAWAEKRGKAVTFVLKGQNNRTEMYSAFKAEVPVPDDPATNTNAQLVAKLKDHGQVAICGEAKSHCVNHSTRDLLAAWPKGREADLVLLTDAMSSVGGFEAAGEEFEKDMAAAGVTIAKTTDFVPK